MHTPHENFRLWLTAESHPRFSAILLQCSTKITYEAPPGIKRNLERTFENWGPEFMVKGNDQLRSQSLITLAWLHALLQERRKYIPQAWTKFYEFNEADLRAGAEMLDRIVGGRASQTGSIDWTIVHGLLENAVYGGRVDNPFDFKVLQLYLRQYFNAEQLSTNAGARRQLAAKIDLPIGTSSTDYTGITTKLPEVEPPALFGLPANIDRSLQRANSTRVIGQLKLLTIPSEAGGKFNREQWAAQLTPIIQAWQKMTEGGGGAALTSLLSEPDDPTRLPIDSFVSMEASNAHALTNLVNSMLGDIVKVISGRMLLTPEIQATGGCLLCGTVPSRWEAKWPDGPESVMTWLRQLVAKTTALDKWLVFSKSGELLKKPLHLGDLFRPNTFLDALRQQSARLEKRSVDSMRLVTTWSSQIKVQCKTAVVVEGLLLQGCAFDSGKLVEAQSTGSDLITAPKCLIAWVPPEHPELYPDTSICEVPLYTNLLREKLVSTLTVPCTATASKWLISGVGLFLQGE